MRSVKDKLFILSLVIASLIITNKTVFASDSLSITIDSNAVNLSPMPDNFVTATQTITASTDNIAGYSIDIATSESTNALVHQTNPNLTIPTFTLPAGTSSLPPASIGYGYGYSIDGGNNYQAIPEAGTYRTVFSTNAPGTHQHDITFGARIEAATPKGDYSNTLVFRAVINLEPCAPNHICYYGNDDDGTGTMPDQPATSNDEAILIPPNFSKPGYGFVSWNTSIDGTGTDYGPNATITTGDLTATGLQLYAKWTPSVGTMQDWNGCGNLNAGDVIALTDERDGSTYAVAKYADNQCWMMENFRLDLSDPDLIINGTNTNHPTSSFAQTITTTHPGSSNSFCSSNSDACINQILHNTNNTNRGLTASYDANNNSSSWYSYGNYYNWYAATAGNGTRDLSTRGAAANGDICPSNWRLPTGHGNAGDLSRLDVAYGGSGINQNTDNGLGPAGSIRWRSYPLNFLYSGEQRDNAGYNRAISNSYVTSNAYSTERTMNLWLRADLAMMNSNNTAKYRGQTIRCVYNENYHLTGNIEYNANGGIGTMPTETNIDFGTATAATNQFTKEHAAFTSWNTSPDGRGTVVAEGGYVATAAENEGLVDGDTLTLYAIWQPVYSLVYNGNNADAGDMSTADVPTLTPGSLQLVASNYSRNGYGFAGWSLDPDAATKLIAGQTVSIYGPNETITVNNAFLQNVDSTGYRINLYAVWLPEDTTHTMQSFTATECSNLQVGETLALTDIRDSNTYAIAKLADNHCWMIENLRLDLNNRILSNTDTNLPTASFVANSPSTSTTNTMCNTDDSNCIDNIYFNTNNINRSLAPAHNTNSVNNSWYSYGVMYNWYTASAGNGDYALATGNVAGDLCPAGWRLPTGGNSGEFVALNNAVNANANAAISPLFKFPSNFIYSGDFNFNKPGGRGTFGRWWSATPVDAAHAYRMGMASSGPTPAGSWSKWDAFAIRCIVK